MRHDDIRSWWSLNGHRVLRVAAVLMILCAAVWLAYEFWRLLFHEAYAGAVDLRQRYCEVYQWFQGKAVYGEFPWNTPYPPATYAILWPLVGWMDFQAARWLWAVTTLAALGWLVYLFVKESGADSFQEKFFVCLIPLSMYATGATIGNGQLALHIMPFLLTGLLLLREKPAKLTIDFAASLFILFALVKPSFSVPFFWLVLFVPGRIRPALMIACGYLACTLFSASFQEPGLFGLVEDWIASSEEALATTAVGYSVSNLHSWLIFWNLEEWLTPSSLAVLSALGVWIFVHRKNDFWSLVGVTALIDRFWTYHAWYDDILIALPMIALFRLIKYGRLKDSGDVTAGFILGLTLVSTMAPGGLYLFPPPFKQIYIAVQLIIWLSALIFLLLFVQRDHMIEKTT